MPFLPALWRQGGFRLFGAAHLPAAAGSKEFNVAEAFFESTGVSPWL
jgi:hypothetical protein